MRKALGLVWEAAGRCQKIHEPGVRDAPPVEAPDSCLHLWGLRLAHLPTSRVTLASDHGGEAWPMVRVTLACSHRDT